MPHKNIRLLTLFNFFTDFKLYAPIAIIYFSQVTGSFALGMSIFSIAMISSALFEIPTGIFSDKIGRKKTVILGSACAVVFSIFYAIGQFYWILALGAVFEGLSRSFYSGNSDALLHDTLSETGQEHNYSEVLGRTSSSLQAALAISAVLGGILATWSFPLIMWLSVIPQTICLLIGAQLVEPKIYSEKSGNIYKHLKEAYMNFIKNRRLRLLSLSSIFGYGFGEATYQFQAAFYSTLWPVWAIAIAKTLSNIGATLSFRFSGRLAKRFGEMKILVVSNIYNRTINIFSTAIPTIFSPLLMSSTSLFFGVTVVSRKSLMQKEFTNEKRATMGSLDSFAGNVFFGIVAIAVGLVADYLSPANALLIINILMFANLFVYWRITKIK